jgi:hypothetical protein
MLSLLCVLFIILPFATVLIMGWLRGNLFCSIFLTLSIPVPLLLLSLIPGIANPGMWVVAGGLLLLILWAPRVLREPDYFGPTLTRVEIIPPQPSRRPPWQWNPYWEHDIPAPPQSWQAPRPLLTGSERPRRWWNA